MWLKNYIYYSTIFSIFTEAFRYHIGFDFKFFYVIIFSNLFALFILKKVYYSSDLLKFHFFILLPGFFSIIFGYNKLGYFLGQVFFIFFITVYYYSFFIFFKNELYKIIKTYCNLSLLLAIVGFIKLPFDLSNGFLLHSIMLEPAHYSTIILPACLITLKTNVYPKYYSFILILSVLLSGSSLGIIGLGFVFLFSQKNLPFLKTLYVFSIVLILGSATYIFYENFRIRVDDSLNVIQTSNLNNANLSTYALMSNFFVSVESFKSNPILGNGMGSHSVSRKKYLNEIEGFESFEQSGWDHLNAIDAGSLFSRVMSELGLFGLIGILYFIYFNYVGSKISIPDMFISRAILIYFLAKLLREGHYFPPEMYFFVFLYVFNFKKYS